MRVVGLIAFLVVIVGCDSTIEPGNTVTEVRIVDGFHSVFVANGIRVELDDTPSDSMRLTIQEGFQPHVRVNLVDSVLSLSMDDHVNLEGWTPATVRLPAVPIRRINLSGGARWTSSRPMVERSLTCALRGGSTLESDVVLDRLEGSLSGGSTMTISGSADVVSFGPVSGGSRVDAGTLQARLMAIEASGGSQVRVNVKDSLFVQASGGSTIRYRGTPHVRQTRTGGSTVTGE
jgi:hypothetical protein